MDKHKVSIASLVTAIALFAMPWLDISCNGNRIASQTGFQAIYGGMDIHLNLDPQGGSGAATEPKPIAEKNRPAKAPILAASLLLAAGAIVCHAAGAKAGSFVALGSLGLLVAQVALRFPIHSQVEANKREQAAQSGGSDPSAGMARAMAGAVTVAVDMRTPVYLAIVAMAGGAWPLVAIALAPAASRPRRRPRPRPEAEATGGDEGGAAE